jgi:hypothetical protein
VAMSCFRESLDGLTCDVASQNCIDLVECELSQRLDQCAWCTKLVFAHGCSVTAGPPGTAESSAMEARIRLARKGSWRLRAYFVGDSNHSATWSGYKYVTVK